MPVASGGLDARRPHRRHQAGGSLHPPAHRSSLMSTAIRDKPRLSSATPGRIRIHLPHWSGEGGRHLEQRVRTVPGVRRVVANPLTANILIGFDPGRTNEYALLDLLNTATQDTDGLPEDKPLPPVIHEAESGFLRRARIAVRGLDRDPRGSRTRWWSSSAGCLACTSGPVS